MLSAPCSSVTIIVLAKTRIGCPMLILTALGTSVFSAEASAETSFLMQGRFDRASVSVEASSAGRFLGLVEVSVFALHFLLNGGRCGF